MVVFSLWSCVPQKELVYLKSPQAIQGFSQALPAYQPYLLQSGDNLYIRISGWDEKTFDFFNPGTARQAQSGSAQENLYYSGYILDEEGYIILPVVGSIKVGGLTLDETRILIRKEVERYLKDAWIVVKLANFNVSVLGEVGTVGRINIYEDKPTVYDVIAMAGDITQYGNRRKVRLIRNYADSTKMFEIDLTRAEMLSDELLYMRPNDILYVEPLRARTLAWNTSQISTYIGLILSVIAFSNIFIKP